MRPESRSIVSCAALSLAALLLLLPAASAQTQEPVDPGPETTSAEATAAAADPVPGGERATPRRAVVGYLTACNKGDFDRAATFLDLGAVKDRDASTSGARLARRLKIVLDRTYWVNPEAISDEPGGETGDGLARNAERLTEIPVDGSSVPILLARGPGPDGTPEWRIDAVTVADIDRLYAEHGVGWLGDWLPPLFFTNAVAEIQLWQLVAIALLILVGWGLSRLVAPQLLRLLLAGGRRTAVGWDDALVKALRGPIRLSVLSVFLYMAVPRLHLEGPGGAFLDIVWKVLVIFALGWILNRWLGIGLDMLSESARLESNQVARSFLPVLSRVAKLLVWVVVAVAVLDSVGVQVFGLVAGLGLGGVAIAFAAQKTIENLFGSFAIAADKPFEVGDFVKIGDTTGTVEDVGLRSTRLRTLARTVVTIPNGSIISTEVENFGARDRFLFKTTVGVLYSTSRAQLELIIDETKKLLRGHPRVHQDVIRVRLDSFGESSINVVAIAWLVADDFHHYTALVEELNFRILEIVEEAGTGFAFPSRTVYRSQDEGINRPKAAEAEKEVAVRRSAGELWIPEPPAAPEQPEDELARDD